MPEQTKPELVFNPNQVNIRLRIPPKFVKDNPCPPEIIERAKIKMDELKSANKVLDFDLFEKKLNRAWTKFKEGKELSLLEMASLKD